METKAHLTCYCTGSLHTEAFFVMFDLAAAAVDLPRSLPDRLAEFRQGFSYISPTKMETLNTSCAVRNHYYGIKI